MTKTVFITRALSADSAFRSLLEAKGWTVAGVSLVTLSPLPFPALPPCDWIFFSSQNAVRFFFTSEGAQPIPGVKWAALGPATAAAMQTFAPTLDFIGTGDPTSSAEAFALLAAGQRVLFPGARHSQESLRQVLGNRIVALPLAIYDNQAVENPVLRSETALVFTSPLNAAAYFERHPKQAHQQLVAIGQSTAAALRERGFEQVTVALEASEMGMAETVEGLF